MIQSIRKKIANHPDWYFAVFSAIVTWLAYAVFIRQLGLHGDDANFIWAYHRGGPEEYKIFFSWNREFGYLFYQTLSRLLRENVLLWHIFCTVLRWLCSFLVYKILKRSFPEQRMLSAWTAIFMLLYPGFLQQSIAAEFTHHFTTLAFLLGSFALTQHMINGKGNRFILFPLSILFELAGLFLIEYFTGLEFFRPVLIWALLCQKTAPGEKGRWKNLIRWELPYALVLGVFIIWRGFFSQSGYIQPNVVQGLSGNPLQYLFKLTENVLSNLKMAGIDAWLSMFRFPSGIKTWLLYGGIVLLSALFFFAFIRTMEEKAKSATASERGSQYFFLAGAFVFLTSGLPIWAAGLQMELALFWDRITLPFMLGASMMLAAFLSILIRRKYQPVVVALLIGIMAGYQFQIQNQFRKDWLLIRNYFWQLQWRAPDIEPNTLVLGDQFPFETITDNSLNALLNWNYENPAAPATEAYKFFQISARLGYLNEFAPGAVTHNAFSGDTGDALVIYATPSTCLKVLTEADRNLPFLSTGMKKSLRLSDPSRIIATPSREIRFQPFMGAEPEHTWCYYFEKGELAAQQGDWEAALALGKQAFALGYQPSTPVELKTFVFSALLTDDLDAAETWIRLITAEAGNEAYYDKAIAAFRSSITPDTLSPEAESLLDLLTAYSAVREDE